MSWLSAGVVGLATLKQGPWEATGVSLTGGLCLALLALAAFGSPLGALGLIGLWVMVIVCAAVLRSTREQGLMFAASGAMGLLLAEVLRFSVEDVAQWWYAALARVIEAAGSDGGQALTQLEQIKVYINPLMAIAAMLSIALAVLFARWWQALIDRPGGFREEFHRLRLPRGTSLLAVAAMVALAVNGPAGRMGGAALDALFVCLGLLAIHGIAVGHALVRLKNRASGWLVGMYLAVLFAPQVALPVLTTVAIADSFVDLRRLADGE
jgi:hypothetical protein